jgi:multicomponent Na+:H+ antiporter subunit C
MLARNVLRFIFGLVLISNAANLTIFTAGRLTPGAPPLIPEGADAPVGTVANALPQALVLTAIVIGFGLFAFALVLMFRAYTSLGTLQSDEMRVAEPRDDGL